MQTTPSTTKTKSLENWKHLCRLAGAVAEDYIAVPGTGETILRYLGPECEMIGAWNLSTRGPGYVNSAPYRIAESFHPLRHSGN